MSNVHAFTSTKTTRFGKGATIVRNNAGLDDAALLHYAPSIFAQDKHDSRSERYTYIPTIDVLAGLRKEGFVPVEVRQGGSKDEVKRNFTKHLVRLRHADQQNIVNGDSFRELILLNAHDGTSSYQLMSGLFRMVCSNGLITCEDGQMQRVAHKGDIVNQVIEGAFRIIEGNEQVQERVGHMSQLQLTSSEQNAFAEAAIELRFSAKDEDGNLKDAPISAGQANDIRRMADRGNDLWKTFNRVQENLIRGGVGYTHQNEDGRRSNRATRPVQSIDGDTSLNRALWVLANKMAELKAA
ncbi:MAG: DUF932 domain-containing protein [Sterolibacterium sp.]